MIRSTRTRPVGGGMHSVTGVSLVADAVLQPDVHRSPATGEVLEIESQCTSGTPVMRAPPVGLQHGLQCSGEPGEVAVVDATVGQLASELAEQLRPVSPGRFEGDADLNPSLDHLHSSPVGGAARVCSQARCRQVAEHHFGIGPRLRGLIGPPHHPQVVAAARRSRPSAGAPAGSGRSPSVGVRWACCRRCCSRARRRARYSGVPLVPMPAKSAGGPAETRHHELSGRSA
jgi:hypothetical protein